MNFLLQHLSVVTSLSVGMMAFGQPTPPYGLYITGTVANCNADSYVNIQSLPGTLPVIDVDVAMSSWGSACTFLLNLSMESPTGGFLLTTPCLGSEQSQTVPYQINFNGGDSAIVIVYGLGCGNSMVDCMGAIGGSALPGSPCTTTGGTPGVWLADCGCVPDTSTYDCLLIANGPNQPGTPCMHPWGFPAIWDANCTCVVLNPDCQGIPNGPSVPGTPCILSTGMLVIPGVWDANCACDTTGAVFPDCLGVMNGPNMPGTPCMTPGGLAGAWTMNCSCVANTNACSVTFTTVQAIDGSGSIPFQASFYSQPSAQAPFTWSWALPNGTTTSSTDVGYVFPGPGSYYLCLTINSTANPPCTATYCDSILVDAAGNVSVAQPLPCEASFLVGQAYEPTPGGGAIQVPYELYVYNMSYGTPPLQFTWDFGDGASSLDTNPSHTYSASGPYDLCLIVTDGTGCTDQFCDSISIDPDGYYTGLMLEEEADGSEERINGFTINVQNPLTLGTSEAALLSDAALWPNPAADAINLALVSRLDGQVAISVIDASGRTVLSTSRNLAAGRSQHSIGIDALPGGMYTLRAADRSGNAIHLRFAK